MLELDSINYFDRLINDCSDMKSGLMKTIVDKYNVKSCVELFGSIISDIAGFKILTLEEMFHHLEWLWKMNTMEKQLKAKVCNDLLYLIM